MATVQDLKTPELLMATTLSPSYLPSSLHGVPNNVDVILRCVQTHSHPHHRLQSLPALSARIHYLPAAAPSTTRLSTEHFAPERPAPHLARTCAQPRAARLPHMQLDPAPLGSLRTGFPQGCCLHRHVPDIQPHASMDRFAWAC